MWPDSLSFSDEKMEPVPTKWKGDCQNGTAFDSSRSSSRDAVEQVGSEEGFQVPKEFVLATSLIDALGISRYSLDALRLINWRKGGTATNATVGNFGLVAIEVLHNRQGTASGGLTIRELNELLYRLASGENRRLV
ncbi:DNA ligase 4 [Vigna unguiculata]|uniref:DNA ligase 4 n=1 Tax=Vigna unguiculata TaxID=3917 RepID=A0A4D6LMG1_VIGUN|nr:DNA ligase 4 [Vigna unguiculata]